MRKTLGNIIHPGVVFGALFVALLLIGIILYFLFYRPIPSKPSFPATPTIFITPAPTSTLVGFTPPTDTPTPTVETPPSPIPGTIVLGGFVQISGTGGTGLNLRAEPELSGTINYLGFESEVFEVADGPVEADGFVWWYLIGFSDPARNGWGASNFLDVIQNPE